MSDQAIALCRVSSPEQLKNNSLNRQDEAVEKCAKDLGVEIVRKWSGEVSSKRGKDVGRSDLKEMLEVCKKNRRIKYLLVDEPDRFMRSISEAFYFEVEFDKLGVKVWYASDIELNSDNMSAKMYRFMKYFSAEGSNEERINKSISGGQKSIREGRLPSSPKAGYKKGTERGVHVIDPPIAIPLQRALKQIASNLKTPTDALKELMQSEFGKRYKNFKMDKFRDRACEPYYAGIVQLKGKFNLRNENGLHEPLITREEHEKILRVFYRTPKNQQGHRKDKDIEYPLTNDLTCPVCESNDRQYPRFTSCRINNGKKRKTTQYYERYRCRGCYRYLDRDETHLSFAELLDRTILPNAELEKLKSKLVTSFNAKHSQAKDEIRRLEVANSNPRQSISNKVEAITDPTNASIKPEIMASIERLKAELADNDEKIVLLNEQHESDLEEFLTFAFDFLSNKGTWFFELSGEDMKRCKQLLFPAKLYVDADKNVYTNEISQIFRGEKNKRDALASQKSNVVDFYNQVRTEFERSA